MRLPADRLALNTGGPPAAPAGVEPRILDERGDGRGYRDAAGEPRGALSYHAKYSSAVDQIILEVDTVALGQFAFDTRKNV